MNEKQSRLSKIDSFRYRKLARRKAMKGGVGHFYSFFQLIAVPSTLHTHDKKFRGRGNFLKSSKALYYGTFFTSILEASDRSGLLCCADPTAVFPIFAPVRR